jgi:16S rRNA (adenine1518-N6/adenine1519-N6)-dimethyltransferase
VRALLDEVGFRPSRKLGQNLLRDENMARAIVRDSGVGPGDFVLEVGPGAGFLSLHLRATGARLLCVEIDARLAGVARRLLGEDPDVEWVEADALASKHRLSPALTDRLPERGPWHVVSNLPYSAGTPILVGLARWPVPPATMTLLLQRELAERLASQPGSADWGPLAVRIQAHYRVRRLRAVPAQVFWPEPRVASALVRLELRGERPGAAAWERLDPLLESLFRHRRQGIGRSLTRILGDRDRALWILGGLGLEAGLRAQELDLEALLRLSDQAHFPDRANGPDRGLE